MMKIIVLWVFWLMWIHSDGFLIFPFKWPINSENSVYFQCCSIPACFNCTPNYIDMKHALVWTMNNMNSRVFSLTFTNISLNWLNLVKLLQSFNISHFYNIILSASMTLQISLYTLFVWYSIESRCTFRI